MYLYIYIYLYISIYIYIFFLQTGIHACGPDVGVPKEERGDINSATLYKSNMLKFSKSSSTCRKILPVANCTRNFGDRLA